MPTWDDVRALGSRLPEVEEGTLYRQPALRVDKKTFAWLSPHEKGALVLRCDPDERPLMIDAQPDVFWVTPHYNDHPMVLVHLDAITREELAERITESWLLAAPPRLVSSWDERD